MQPEQPPQASPGQWVVSVALPPYSCHTQTTHCPDEATG